jgi:guanine deaminase
MIKEKGAAISHCPDSNLFLGSGFYKIEDAKNLGVMTSIGSDIGGGTTVNLLKILAECYKMHKMNKYTLSPVEAFYLITLGGAKALHLDDHLGKIKEGYYADLVVLDPKGSEYLKAKDMITI